MPFEPKVNLRNIYIIMHIPVNKRHCPTFSDKPLKFELVHTFFVNPRSETISNYIFKVKAKERHEGLVAIIKH